MIIPRQIQFKNWAASLIQDFGNDDVPVLMDEKNWKSWAYQVIQEESFASQGAPSPATFKTKEDWANALFSSMANF